MSISIPYAQFIAQGVTLEGFGSHNINGVEKGLDTESLPNAVLNTSRVKLDFDSAHRHLAFCMKPEAVQRKLSALTGIASDKKLFLAEDTRMSAAELLRFRRLLLLLINELEDTANPPSKVLIRELEQALMVAFLVGNQHSFSQFLECRTNDVAPWQVKRVEQYIEAHWNEFLNIRDSIAAAVAASVRSIQMSFRTSRGYTPMEFARKIRLQHARRMLSNPDTGTSVTDVVYACCLAISGIFPSSISKSSKSCRPLRSRAPKVRSGPGPRLGIDRMLDKCFELMVMPARKPRGKLRHVRPPTLGRCGFEHLYDFRDFSRLLARPSDFSASLSPTSRRFRPPGTPSTNCITGSRQSPPAVVVARRMSFTIRSDDVTGVPAFCLLCTSPWIYDEPETLPS